MKNDKQMPILGIGNDILEIERIRDSIAAHGEKFLSKLFTPKEQDYCNNHSDPIPHFAGRFSAKEAIVKALGTGIGGHASWLDFEILNDSKGRPSVFFSEKMREKLQKSQILISISHCKLYATAFAIWVEGDRH
jgi:holo-[acyl-carrier protein] synthase